MLDIDTTNTKYVKVYYDTLFHVSKNSDKHDILNIYKLDFDYSTSDIRQRNIPISIDFGNSNSVSPYNSTRSSFVSTILLPDEKSVLIFGLTWLSANLTQTINGQTHVGDAYKPVVYKYDMNSHELTVVYDGADDGWNSFLQGDKISSQPVLVAYDENSKKITYFYRTNRTVNSITERNMILIDFLYKKDHLILDDVKIRKSVASNGNYNSTIVYQRLINNDNRYILIAAGCKSNKKKILFIELTDI